MLRSLPPAVPDQHVGQVEQADRDRARLAELALDDEVLFEQLPGPAEIPVVDLDQGHVVRRHGQFRAVADRGAQVERGLEAEPGLGPFAQVALGRSEHGGREGQVLARVEWFEDAHRLPGQANRLGVVAGLRGQHGGRAQGPPDPLAFLRCPHGAFAGRGEELVEPTPASGEPATGSATSATGQRRPPRQDRSRRSRGSTAASRAGRRRLTPAGRPSDAYPARRESSSSGWPRRRNAWRADGEPAALRLPPAIVRSRTPGWPRPC